MVPPLAPITASKTPLCSSLVELALPYFVISLGFSCLVFDKVAICLLFKTDDWRSKAPSLTWLIIRDEVLISVCRVRSQDPRAETVVVSGAKFKGDREDVIEDVSRRREVGGSVEDGEEKGQS